MGLVCKASPSRVVDQDKRLDKLERIIKRRECSPLHILVSPDEETELSLSGVELLKSQNVAKGGGVTSIGYVIVDDEQHDQFGNPLIISCTDDYKELYRERSNLLADLTLLRDAKDNPTLDEDELEEVQSAINTVFARIGEIIAVLPDTYWIKEDKI